jgi:type VI secretion system protein ImpA
MTQDVKSILQKLIQPIALDDPCGPSLRYDSLYTDIRLAREEDDPNLPMRQWERPLKRADWGFIESSCINALTQSSKDLQLVAWLTEAWMRMNGLIGLESGLSLLNEMTVRFWDQVHPQINDEDTDARKSPFDWLSESLSASLKVHVVLITVFERSPSKITLAEWEKLTADDVNAQDMLYAKESVAPVEADFEPLDRAELLSITKSATKVEPLLMQLDSVRGSLNILSQIKLFLDGKLGLDSPNLSRLTITLQQLERVLETMTAVPNMSGHNVPVQSMQGHKESHSGHEGGNMDDDNTSKHASVGAITGPWHSRDQAYATLEAVADYLQKREPHSPTPYLIKKAVRWGRLPLPELMQEIMREEGDLNRMSNLFGHTEP